MTSDRWLSRLTEIAASDEPPELTTNESERMIATALDGVGGRATQEAARKRLRKIAAGIGVLVAAAAAAALVWLGPRDRTTPHATVRLASGDEISAATGTRFDIAQADDEMRRVRLEEGAMLFDVAPLDDGERFIVETPHLSVEVRGTVFSVETRDGESTVRVFEGKVDVSDGTRQGSLHAHESLQSSRWARDDTEVATSFATEGIAAAARRRTEQPNRWSESASTVEAMGTAESFPATSIERETAGPADRVEPRPPFVRVNAQRDSDIELPTVASVRSRIADDPQGALVEARRYVGEPWRLVEADALRALQRHTEAAGVYERLIAEAHSERTRVFAGYQAATLRFVNLSQPELACEALERSGALGSPQLTERSLGLYARALMAAGREAEASATAETYLARFPDGGLADWMRQLIEPARAP